MRDRRRGAGCLLAADPQPGVDGRCLRVFEQETKCLMDCIFFAVMAGHFRFCFLDAFVVAVAVLVVVFFVFVAVAVVHGGGGGGGCSALCFLGSGGPLDANA